MTQYRGWRIAVQEAARGGWGFVATRLPVLPCSEQAAGGEVDRVKSLSTYPSREEALAEARSMVDREPWRPKPE